MEISKFKDMYLAELQELMSMEDQLGGALLRMADAASHSALKSAFVDHRAQTELQKQRLESVLQKHGANPRAHTDQAMQSLVNETEKMLAILNGNDLRDAGLRSSSTTRSRPMAPLQRSRASWSCATTRGYCTRASRRRSRLTSC